MAVVELRTEAGIRGLSYTGVPKPELQELILRTICVPKSGSMG